MRREALAHERTFAPAVEPEAHRLDKGALSRRVRHVRTTPSSTKYTESLESVNQSAAEEAEDTPGNTGMERVKNMHRLFHVSSFHIIYMYQTKIRSNERQMLQTKKHINCFSGRDSPYPNLDPSEQDATFSPSCQRTTNGCHFLPLLPNLA